MKHAVFSTRKKTKRALLAFRDEKADISNICIIDDTVKKNHLTIGPAPSKSALQRWSTRPTPIIKSCCCEFYLKVTEHINRALL